MPHIAITMYPGRSDEIKKSLAIKMKQVLMEELGVAENVCSISIENVAKEDWQARMDAIPADAMIRE